MDISVTNLALCRCRTSLVIVPIIPEPTRQVMNRL
jgi:hypothetical protein